MKKIMEMLNKIFELLNSKESEEQNCLKKLDKIFEKIKSQKGGTNMTINIICNCCKKELLSNK
jgi:hypothetical protein